MTKQLKPCPFCEGVNLNLNCDDKRLMCDTVECNGCGALVPSAEWNDRTDGWIIVDIDPIGDGDCITVDCWSNGRRVADCMYLTGLGIYMHHTGKIEASHWMPLPQPPKVTK